MASEVTKEAFTKILDDLKSDLATLRVGRANPIMVEGIIVEAYGAKTPLKQLASVSVPEARNLIIQPWDKSIIKDVEKAINASDIGVSPIIDGNNIRLTFPQLTEESRQELTKRVSERLEAARIKARKVRDGLREEVTGQEQAKEISEDDKFKNFEEIDKAIKQFNDQAKEVGDKKRDEIMTI
tara:strand:+ start:243 stop:791 length:549 start_codon:yes stop_codon:yes gene_type:complete